MRSTLNTIEDYPNYWKLTDKKTTDRLMRSDRMAVTQPKTMPIFSPKQS